MCQKLTNLQIDLLPVCLPRWRPVSQRSGAIKRMYYFEHFNQVFGFMALVSLQAEGHQHRPHWVLTGSCVEMTLTLQEGDTLSDEDVTLARFADEAFSRQALAA